MNLIEKSFEDFIFLSGYDFIKKKNIPNTDLLIVNGLSSLGYNYMGFKLCDFVVDKFFKSYKKEGYFICKSIIYPLLMKLVENYAVTKKSKGYMSANIFMKSFLSFGAQSLYKMI